MHDTPLQLPRNPVLRQGHLNRRCHVCDLAWSHPQVYDWCEQALLEGELTQVEIAAELERRTGLRFDQPQLSNHRSRHVEPMLAEYRQAFAAHEAALAIFGDLGPEQMAVVHAQLTSLKVQQAIDGLDVSDPEQAPVLAKLAAAQAAIDRTLQTAVKTTHEVDALQHANHAAAIAEQMTEGQFREQFVAWVEAHFPEMLPYLDARLAAESSHE